MRFVASNCLREGMCLARPLYRNLDIMLSSGVTLTQQFIEGIHRCGFTGVYIEDELSEGIEVNTMISDSLRRSATKSLRSVLSMASSGDEKKKVPDLSLQVESLVDELFSNRDVMVNMLDLSCYDDYTCNHSLNVAILSIVLSMGMGFTHAEKIGIGMGALLHDIGKVFVDKRILNKNGALTDEEFFTIQKHPLDGYNYISRRYRIPRGYCSTIVDHHEKYDGTGYPCGKMGTDISLYGRICAVADVYDALSNKRPYRDAMPACECVEYIMGGAGSLFDPEIVEVFTRRIAPYPVGTSVILSNGWKALVVENFINFSLRPRLRVYEQNGERVLPFELSLKDDIRYLSVTIKGIG